MAGRAGNPHDKTRSTTVKPVFPTNADDARRWFRNCTSQAAADGTWDYAEDWNIWLAWLRYACDQMEISDTPRESLLYELLTHCCDGGPGGGGSGNCLAFAYTGGLQTFTVPAGVTELDAAHLWGAAGGGRHYANGADDIGGAGGYATGKITVTPGEDLTLLVGQGGISQNSSTATFGYGGRGGAGSSGAVGSGGGGLTGIFRGAVSQANALLIAGGGGGSPGLQGLSDGGAGGGSSGQSGASAGSGAPGQGGTQVAGGAGGGNGTAGSALQGGDGGAQQFASGGGGGGGGGYYGGGGGQGHANGVNDAGGGGGAGFIAGSGISDGLLIAGSGRTPPNLTSPHYLAGIGVGGDSTNGGAGGNGRIVLCY